MKDEKLNKKYDTNEKCRYDFVRPMLERSDGMESVEYAVMAALTIASLIVALGAMALAISGRLGGFVGIS